MRTKRPLTPGFLNRFDNYFLTHKPEVWSARTHLVAYYGILFIAVLTALSFAIPDDPRTSSPMFYWIGFVVIISMIALTVWLIYLLRFNVFKRYGNIPPLSRLTTFLLYFVAIAIIIVFPLVMPLVESYRANKAYGDKEVSNDINNINSKICQLEYDSLPHALKPDTIQVVDSVPQYRTMPQEEDDLVDTTAIAVSPSYNHEFRLVDTASLRTTLMGADSSIRLNDSMYVLLSSRNYTFIRSYYNNFSDTMPDTYSNFDLYKRVIRNSKPLVDRRQVRSELYAILNKYKVVDETSYAYDYGYSDDGEDRNYYDKIKKKYELDQVNRNIDNVVERKYRWDKDNTEFVFRLCYYATLVITLLVFAFRHSTKKAFFLSLLTAVILTILTALFEAYFSPASYADYLWLIGYAVLFFIISLQCFRSKIRYTITGIGINLFLFVVAFLPSSIVDFYYKLKMDELNDKANTSIINEDKYIDYTAMHQAMLIAEIGGSVLLLVLLATYIPRVYRQWYALPEE